MNLIKDRQADDYSEVSKVQALTRVAKTQIEFCWKIVPFSFCTKKQDLLESSTFSSEKETDCLKWRMRLYTKGINDRYRDYMGLFLVLVQDKSINKRLPKEVIYNFCILNTLNQKVNLVRSHDGREFKESDSWGFPKFLLKNVIEKDYNNLVPNDQLTILVEMCVFGHISTSDKTLDRTLIDTDSESKRPKDNFKPNKLTRKKSSKKRLETELTKSKDFKDFLLNNKYSDLIILTSDAKELPVHRIILANESPIFLHKFDSSQSNKLELKNFDSQTVTDILSYIYTKNLNFKSNLDKLLSFADIYQLKELKLFCENEMINKITISSAAQFYLFSSQCNAENLKEKVFEFLKVNFNKIIETEEWKQLQETQSHLVNEIYKQLFIDK